MRSSRSTQEGSLISLLLPPRDFTKGTPLNQTMVKNKGRPKKRIGLLTEGHGCRTATVSRYPLPSSPLSLFRKVSLTARMTPSAFFSSVTLGPYASPSFSVHPSQYYPLTPLCAIPLNKKNGARATNRLIQIEKRIIKVR